MKGITHFAAGVAAASCFPYAVEAGASGNPLYFILGGCCGLLPDTFDFKFSRFFHKHDMEVTPDPAEPDAQMIADSVALAVHRANETGHPVRLKLNTIRLGADRWRRYEIKFDIPAGQVEVTYGPVVDTGRQETGEKRPQPRAVSELGCDIKLNYMATTVVDIFDGPFFRMTPREDDTVLINFLPWHRAWSHSLSIGLLLALLSTQIWDGRAGWVAFCGHAAHVAVDQLGFMGSNIFYPFTAHRLDGLKWVHSGESFPNSMVVWGCCLLVFWNLSRLATDLPAVNPLKLIFYGLVLPLVTYKLLLRFQRRHS